MSDAADKRIDELEKELYGTQEMLAAVLYTIADPVQVPKKSLVEIPRDSQINIVDDGDVFTFSLTTVSEVQPD